MLVSDFLYDHPSTLVASESQKTGWLPPAGLDGRSIVVKRVTNLNASGTGSLDAAVNNSDARSSANYTIVVFDVSGRIDLNGGSINITDADGLIVAAETAPGHVELWDGRIILTRCERTLVRHHAIRQGSTTARDNADAAQIRGCDYTTLQNCSFANSRDEQVSIETSTPNTQRFGLLDCLVAFPLGEPVSVKDHRFGFFARYPNSGNAVARNLLVGARRGYPRVSHPCGVQFYNNFIVAGTTDEAPIVDDGGDGNTLNLDNFDNEYVWFTRAIYGLNNAGISRDIYDSGNVVRGSYSGAPQSATRGSVSATWLNGPQFVPAYKCVDKSLISVRDFVMAHAGARPANRDATDALAISEVQQQVSTQADKDRAVNPQDSAVITRSTPVNNAPASISRTYTPFRDWNGTTDGVRNALLDLDELHAELGGVPRWEVVETPDTGSEDDDIMGITVTGRIRLRYNDLVTAVNGGNVVTENGVRYVNLGITDGELDFDEAQFNALVADALATEDVGDIETRVAYLEARTEQIGRLASDVSQLDRRVSELEGLTTDTQGPYGGTAPSVSATGTTEVLAKNFDTGGENVSYYTVPDTRTTGAGYDASFRTSDAPDVSFTTAGNLAPINTKNWYEWTLNVSSAGDYDIDLYTIANAGDITVKLEFSQAEEIYATRDDITLTQSASFVANTVEKVGLKAGTNVLRITFNKVGANMQKFAISPHTPEASPGEGTAFLHPATVARAASEHAGWQPDIDADCTILRVTNRNDSGEGSWRYQAQRDDITNTRVIVFDVHGKWNASSELSHTRPNTIVAGQTAGGHIGLFGNRASLRADRQLHMHYLAGGGYEANNDSFQVINASRWRVQNVSVCFSRDEIFSVDNRNLGTWEEYGCIVDCFLHSPIKDSADHRFGNYWLDSTRKSGIYRSLIAGARRRCIGLENPVGVAMWSTVIAEPSSGFKTQNPTHGELKSAKGGSVVLDQGNCIAIWNASSNPEDVIADDMTHEPGVLASIYREGNKFANGWGGALRDETKGSRMNGSVYSGAGPHYAPGARIVATSDLFTFLDDHVGSRPNARNAIDTTAMAEVQADNIPTRTAPFSTNFTAGSQTFTPVDDWNGLDESGRRKILVQLDQLHADLGGLSRFG